jgi:U4/U6.U5 tri-snRNP-associated protein 2
MIAKIDKVSKPSMALDGTEYIPGFVGLNNVKDTDFMNSTIQALLHVPALRNFFLKESNYAHLVSNDVYLADYCRLMTRL